MCYVIVTTRTLLWTLLTIAATLGMLSALVTPRWIVGAPKAAIHPSKNKTLSTDGQVSHEYPSSTLPAHSTEAVSSRPGRESTFTPTVGIFNRCTRVQHSSHSFHFNCAPFISDFSMPSDEFPGFWKASLIFLSIGISLMTFTICTSIVGCCVRAIFKKSIFTVSGTVQAVAGLFYIFGLVFYPAGWSSKRVLLLCGEEADYYMLGTCSLGWAFYLALASTIGTFACAILSVYADSSTSSDKVQDEIFEGKNLICLL